MNSQQFTRLAVATAASLLAAVAAAQAPGEDPVVVRTRPAIDPAAAAPQPRSGNIDNLDAMPAWMRARIARYQARAFAMGDQNNILTDNDVVTTNAAQGMRKTCVQEVGSNTTSGMSPGMRFGPQPREQVVVLRGDLVNICN